MSSNVWASGATIQMQHHVARNTVHGSSSLLAEMLMSHPWQGGNGCLERHLHEDILPHASKQDHTFDSNQRVGESLAHEVIQRPPINCDGELMPERV